VNFCSNTSERDVLAGSLSKHHLSLGCFLCCESPSCFSVLGLVCVTESELKATVNYVLGGEVLMKKMSPWRKSDSHFESPRISQFINVRR